MLSPFFYAQRFSPRFPAPKYHNKSDEPTLVPHLPGMARRFYQPQNPLLFYKIYAIIYYQINRRNIMPLSRKYYIKFADLFAEHNRGVSAEFRNDFENLLKTDNPRFNRERFADHIAKNSRE